MAEGGRDPEFNLPTSADEATPDFASLNALACHLPSSPPRYNNPWSVPTEPQQQQSHTRGVRAEKKVRAEPERKEYERAQRQEQRAVEGQETGDVSSRPTLLLPDDALRRVARVPVRVRLPRRLPPPPGAGRGARLLAAILPPPMSEPPPGWNYGDARPIGSYRSDELPTNYRQHSSTCGPSFRSSDCRRFQT